MHSWDGQGRGQCHGATQERQESHPGVTVTPTSDCRWSGEALDVGAESTRQSQGVQPELDPVWICPS